MVRKFTSSQQVVDLLVLSRGHIRSMLQLGLDLLTVSLDVHLTVLVLPAVAAQTRQELAQHKELRKDGRGMDRLQCVEVQNEEGDYSHEDEWSDSMPGFGRTLSGLLKGEGDVQGAFGTAPKLIIYDVG